MVGREGRGEVVFEPAVCSGLYACAEKGDVVSDELVKGGLHELLVEDVADDDEEEGADVVDGAPLVFGGEGDDAFVDGFWFVAHCVVCGDSHQLYGRR